MNMKFIYKDTSLIEQTFIEDNVTVLKDYTKHLQAVSSSKTYDAPESSLNLPSDEAVLKEVLQVKGKVNSNLKYVVDIGKGGSNLGTKAVYDALYGYYDLLQPDRFPKMIFLDTIDTNVMQKFISLLGTIQNTDEIIVNAISKSGGTTETVANLEIVLKVLTEKFGEYAKERIVITTDEGSKLWKHAEIDHFDVLPIPKQVGGRFSVLSAVGLFPLACAGIDISELLKGANEMKEYCIQDSVDNPALISAITIFLHSKQGRTINDSFFFLPQLESIGKWYRQLTGESLGKEHDLEGNVVHAGVTPTVSIGSTDLHSVGQLYLGGPRDKTTTFIYSTRMDSTLSVPSQLTFPLVEGIKNKSMPDIMYAIREGVKIAYKKQELPYMEVALERVDEHSLGEFLQFKMIEMMYLGKLLNVNTFDQPHVELYKNETKKILNQ